MPSTEQSDAAFMQLCHHLSLTRHGKVQGAVDSLVLTVLAIDTAAGEGDANEVAQALSTYFSVELPVGEVRKLSSRTSEPADCYASAPTAA